MSVLRELAQELGLSTQEFKELLYASDETLVPTYLTTGADGSVGAEFTGIVHAHGLDLPAGTTPNPGNTSRIRWIKQSDGSVVAEMLAYDGDGTQGALDLRAESPGGHTTLIRQDTRDTSFQNAAIFVQADDIQRLIFDNQQRSDFIQQDSDNAGLRRIVDRGQFSVTPPILAAGASTTVDFDTAALEFELGDVDNVVFGSQYATTILVWGYSRVDSFTLRFHIRNSGPATSSGAEVIRFWIRSVYQSF